MNANERVSATLAELERTCREHALPLTAQRRAVLAALCLRSDHPTVDEVWEDVRVEMPEISRTTVYRILETFSQFRIIRKVCHPGAVARYERKMRRHHHLVCIQCGSVEDLDAPALDHLRLPGPETGFQVEDYSIHFRGLCKKCAAEAAPGKQAEPRRKASKTPGRGPSRA
jgi:Fur family peroxide stress response transcriptional regulator